MNNKTTKTLIKKKISDNIYIISEDDTNEILYSEIQALLEKQDYSDYPSDLELMLNS